METNSDKKFDAFLKKAVKETGLDSPSENFTAILLSKIDEQTVYSPLISKSIWGVLAICVLSIFTFIVLTGQSSEVSWFYSLNWEGLAAIDLLNKFPTFDVSNTVVYGFVILAFFIGIQVVLLKHHFDKRYAIN